MSLHYITLDWPFIRDKGTTMQEKLLFAEICQLSTLDRGCVASNKHFATLLGVKKESVSRSLKSLQDKGYIFTEIKGGSRNMDRVITINKMLLNDNKMLFQSITKCLETKETRRVSNKRVVFKKPTASDIKAYLIELDKPDGIDPDYFIDHYDSNGWVVGKNKMKDWKATIRNWLRRDSKSNNQKQSKTEIKQEIFARISRGVQNGYTWKSPEAEAVFNKMRQLPGGVPWNGNEWQINNAISEVI